MVQHEASRNRNCLSCNKTFIFKMNVHSSSGLLLSLQHRTWTTFRIRNDPSRFMNKQSNSVIQSEFVLSQRSVTFEKPPTAHTSPVKKLFTVLIQTDFGLEALEANSAGIKDINKARRIFQTARAKAVNTVQKRLATLVPYGITKVKTVFIAWIVRRRGTFTLPGVLFHPHPLLRIIIITCSLVCLVTQAVPCIRMKATMPFLTTTAVSHFPLQTSLAVATAAFLVKIWLSLILLEKYIHVSRRSAPCCDEQVVAAPWKRTSVFLQRGGAVQERWVLKHILNVFNPFCLDIIAFPNLFQLSQDPEPSVIQGVPFPLLRIKHHFDERNILQENFSIFELSKCLKQRNSVVKFGCKYVLRETYFWRFQKNEVSKIHRDIVVVMALSSANDKDVVQE